MKFDTKVVRSGISPDPSTGAIVPPIYQSATYVLEEVGKDKGYDYTRASNPTRAVLENNLADLDGGKHGICFSSGMAAVDSIMKLFKSGDHIVCSDDVYGGVSRLYNNLLVNYDLTFTYVNSSNPQEVEDAIQDNTKLIWIETPSNPILRLTDIKAVTDTAKQCGALVAADNTFLSPALQNPIKFGADIVVHSTTKYINGHSDVVGGAVIAATAELGEELAWWANNIGITGAPFDSYLTLRGLRTLNVRLRQHQENALAIAQYLERSQFVAQVYYPGLESHPQHALAKAQQLGFGAMVSFDIKGDINDAAAFLTRLNEFSLAESLGGVESLICHPATMTHAGMDATARAEAGVGDTLIRISVGIEDVNDLLADLDRVFNLVRPGQANLGLSAKSGASESFGSAKLNAAYPVLW